jgi:outer membrane protein assembly factor BamB
MSQHDPQNTGRTNVTGPKSLNIIWSKFIETGLLSGPVIDNENNLYFGNDHQLSDFFYCITAKADSSKWKIQTGDGDRLSDGMIITSSGNIICRGFTFLYSFSKEGKVNWKYPFDGLRQNFNITLYGYLLAIDGNHNLIKLSPEGELLLQIKYDDGFYPGTAITPDGIEIILNGKNENLYCLDLNGTVVWQKFSGKSNKPPLIDSNGKIYICTIGSEGQVKRYNREGELEWEYKVPGGIMDVGEPTIDKNGNFYFYGDGELSGYLSICSIDYFGKKRWIYPLTDELNSGYIAHKIACDSEGNLYFGSDQGYYYYCLDFNGNLLWQYSLDGIEIDGSPAFGSDGALYFGGHDGSNGQSNLFGIGKN